MIKYSKLGCAHCLVEDSKAVLGFCFFSFHLKIYLLLFYI